MPVRWERDDRVTALCRHTALPRSLLAARRRPAARLWLGERLAGRAEHHELSLGGEALPRTWAARRVGLGAGFGFTPPSPRQCY